MATVAVDLLCGNVPPSDAGTLGSLVVTAKLVPGDNCPALAGWFILRRFSQYTIAATPNRPNSMK